MNMNISCRIANANTLCGRITNPPERKIEYNYIYIAFILCITMLMPSCVLKRKHMYHFSQSDSLYFNMYDTLQYYTFKTNKGIDTLIFTRKQIEENYNEWYIDIVDGTIFNAFSYSEGVFRHNGSNEEIHISHRKDADNKDPVLNIILGERYAMPIDEARNFSKTGIYKDTIIIDDTNSHLNHYRQHNYTFEYLKWHKYKGIVEYKLSDGTIYKGNI